MAKIANGKLTYRDLVSRSWIILSRTFGVRMPETS